MERSFESAAALVGRAAGPVSEHLGPFVDLLIGQQFVAAVVYVKAMHAVAFNRWLAQHDVDPAELSEVHIQRFLRRRRRHRGPIRPETRRREEYDVQQVLGFLRSRGVCAQAIASSTPVEDLVAAFARHLREQQGLASPTIERYTIVALQFLENHFSAGAVDLRAVVATDIIEFIRGQVAHLRPPGLKCVVTAMRSSCAMVNTAATSPANSLSPCRPWPLGRPHLRCPGRSRPITLNARSTAATSARRSGCAIGPSS